MVKIKQKTEEDCYRCCLAMTTGIEYEEIPDFFEDTKDLCIQEVHGAVAEWLDKKGFLRIRFKVEYDEEKNELTWFSMNRNIEYIAILKKDNEKDAHAVIMNINEEGYYQIYDPADASGFDARDIKVVEIIIENSNK